MKSWLHFILHEDGRSLYENQNGGISSSSTPRHLVNTPDGWKDISVGYQRDMKKKGLIKSFTFPLSFVLDGAKILRKFLYEAGIEFKLFYLIAQRKIEILTSPDQFKDYYTKWYRGEIDFSTFSDQENKTICTIGPTGLEKSINAEENTVYEFPLSDPDASLIELDGMNLFSTVTFNAPPEVEFDDSVYARGHIIPFGVTAKEGLNYGVAVFDQYMESASTPNTFFVTSQNFFLAVDSGSQPVDITMTGKLIVKVTKRNIPAFVRFRLRSNFGPAPFGTIIDLPGVSAGVGVEVIIPVNITLTVQPGEHIFLEGIEHGLFATGAIGFAYVFMPGSDIVVTYKNRMQTSYIKGFRPDVLLDKIVEKISGRPGKTVSNLLSSDPFKKLYITSGDGIRGISSAVLKISLAKFTDIYSVLAYGGYSIEKDKLRFENVDSFFNPLPAPPDAVIDLGEASSLKVSVAKDLLVNTIEIGHQNKDIENLNGKLRFNNIHQYSTPVKRVNNKLTLVSPAMADPYIIEHERINFMGKKTTDANKDNDFFILHAAERIATNIEGLAEKSKESIVGANTIINFSEFNNVGLIPNSNKSEFTWFGQPVQVTFTLYVAPVSLPTSGESVTAQLLINGNNVAQQAIAANGINTILITFTTTINNGDFTSVRLIHATGGTISVADISLKIRFNNLLIASLFRDTYSRIEGVRDDTVFNIELLTPKRLLILWKKYLNSLFYRLDGKKYVFETSDRNPDLLTEKNNVVIDEDADEPITADILFKPYIFEIETQVPVDLADILDNNQNLPFQFSWSGNVYKGFLMKGGIAPDDNRSQVFQLLCSPDTDETNLIL